MALRYGRDASVLEAIFNLGTEDRRVPLGQDYRWDVVLATDAPGYGGAGSAALEGELRLPGHTGVLLRGAAA